jgi:putative Mg2+ transporter-C (MgtC) family protein
MNATGRPVFLYWKMFFSLNMNIVLFSSYVILYRVRSVGGYRMLEEYLVSIGRLVVAGVLGGIVGYEREHTKRPAGFRTHILVCIGSALVMITSEFLFKRYSDIVNMDPARLGAQVISGIGFLGAGTIIREGASVKGLTTAASLWAVSCIGIAAGSGFYMGAISATVLTFVTLIFLKRMESQFAVKKRYSTIYVHTGGMLEQIRSVKSALEKMGVASKGIEVILKNEEADDFILKFRVKIPKGLNSGDVIAEICSIEGLKKVYAE